MARKIKSGLDFFSFDTEFFSDIKIRKLIKFQGGKAITVYAYLLCSIYKNGYYMRWDKELPFIISEATGYEEAYIQEVIKCCLNVGLFSKELYHSDNVLTSKGIQERYDYIAKFKRWRISIVQHSLLNVQEQPINVQLKGINVQERALDAHLVHEIESEIEIESEKERANPPPQKLFPRKVNMGDFDLFQIDELLVAEIIKIYSLTQYVKITSEQVVGLFEIFKKQVFSEEKHYNSERDIYSHFTSWMKFQKIKDGSKQTNSGGKLGTSAARIEALKNFGQHL